MCEQFGTSVTLVNILAMPVKRVAGASAWMVSQQIPKCVLNKRGRLEHLAQ